MRSVSSVSLIYYVVVSAETLFAFEGDFCGRVLVVCNAERNGKYYHLFLEVD
jgi:hypothetical protein